MNTAAHAGGHGGVSTDRDMIIGCNALKECKKMNFKHTGRFMPDRLKSDPKSTFSRPVSLPQKTNDLQIQNPKLLFWTKIP